MHMKNLLVNARLGSPGLSYATKGAGSLTDSKERRNIEEDKRYADHNDAKKNEHDHLVN